MNFSLANMKDTGKTLTVPETLYSIWFPIGLSDTDIMSIVNKCRRGQKKYPHVSWFVAVSTTTGNTASKKRLRTGKKGRPKTIVRGKKVRKHIHMAALGSNGKSALAFVEDVKKTFNKRISKRKETSLGFATHQSMRIYDSNGDPITLGAGFITYAYRQADEFYSGGDFDFRPFFGGYYHECFNADEKNKSRILKMRATKQENRQQQKLIEPTRLKKQNRLGF